MGWMASGRVELRRSILVAMGLAGCATRVLPGGEDGGEGSGTDTDDGESTGASTTVGTTAMTTIGTATQSSVDSGEGTSDDGHLQCEVDPTVWNQFQVCVPRTGASCGFCDDDPECRAAAEQVAGVEGGFCAPAFIGTQCGPEAFGEQCCSVVLVDDWGCEGRPFIVAGEHRSAAACVRDDWHAGVHPQLDALSPGQRAALGEHWRAVALAEHASIASFSRFVLELLEVGAPAELVAAAGRAMADEIVHARLAFGLATAYLAEASGPGPLPVDGAFAGPRGLAALVRAAIVEGCIGETVSAARCELAHDGCSDPAARRVLETLARDERRHAQLAWQFVAWALRVDPGLCDTVADAFTAALVGIDLSPPPPLGPAFDVAAVRAHGLLTAAEEHALTRTVAHDVIAPCFAALLGDDATLAA